MTRDRVERCLNSFFFSVRSSLTRVDSLSGWLHARNDLHFSMVRNRVIMGNARWVRTHVIAPQSPRSRMRWPSFDIFTRPSSTVICSCVYHSVWIAAQPPGNLLFLSCLLSDTRTTRVFLCIPVFVEAQMEYSAVERRYKRTGRSRKFGLRIRLHLTQEHVLQAAYRCCGWRCIRRRNGDGTELRSRCYG